MRYSMILQLLMITFGIILRVGMLKVKCTQSRMASSVAPARKAAHAYQETAIVVHMGARFGAVKASAPSFLNLACTSMWQLHAKINVMPNSK